MFRTEDEKRARRKNDVVVPESAQRAHKGVENLFAITATVRKNILRAAGPDQSYGALIFGVTLLYMQGLPRAFLFGLSDTKTVFPRLAVGGRIADSGNFATDVEKSQANGPPDGCVGAVPRSK